MLVSREETLEDALDFEVINDTRRKLADIHNRLEDIIYNTDLIMGSALPPESILLYCPRCGTGLVSHEVAQGYKEVKVLTLTAKFKRKDADEYFLFL